MGVLAAADLAAETATLLYECPSGRRAFAAVNLAARTQEVSVRVALTSGESTPTDADWIEWDVPLEPGGTPLLREGLMLAADDRVYVRASATGVSAVAYGQEEDA